MDRILPDEQGDLFPQDGETQRPVRQQQRTPDVGRVAGVQPHDPAGQSDPDDDLQSLDDHDPTEEPLVGPCPLDQQALVLPAHGTLRPVGAHRGQPQEGIQVEAAQRARVRPDAQVEPLEEGVEGER